MFVNRATLSVGRVLKNHLTRTLTSNPAPDVEVAETITEKNIIVEKLGSITTIGINCPEKKNILNVSSAQNLSEAIDEFEKDEESSVAVLHGIGGSFCAGYDLKEIANYDGKSEDSLPQFGPLSNRKSLPSKPMIAAVSGYTVGVGFELAIMCDLRVVEETAVMGVFNRRFGIPMLNGGTVRLPALIGYSRAMDLILTGKGISGEQAFNWGLASRLVACGTSLGQAISLAQCIMKFPQSCLLADRESAHYATFSAQHIEEALQFEKDNASHILLDEGVQGAKRFVDGLGRHGKFRNINPSDRTKFTELSDDIL